MAIYRDVVLEGGQQHEGREQKHPGIDARYTTRAPSRERVQLLPSLSTTYT